MKQVKRLAAIAVIMPILFTKELLVKSFRHSPKHFIARLTLATAALLLGFSFLAVLRLFDNPVHRAGATLNFTEKDQFVAYLKKTHQIAVVYDMESDSSVKSFRVAYHGLEHEADGRGSFHYWNVTGTVFCFQIPKGVDMVDAIPVREKDWTALVPVYYEPGEITVITGRYHKGNLPTHDFDNHELETISEEPDTR